MELPALSSHCTQGLALTHVLEQNLKPVAGLRPEAAKLVILVTDGKSQDDARTAGHVLKDRSYPRVWGTCSGTGVRLGKAGREARCWARPAAAAGP